MLNIDIFFHLKSALYNYVLIKGAVVPFLCNFLLAFFVALGPNRASLLWEACIVVAGFLLDLASSSSSSQIISADGCLVSVNSLLSTVQLCFAREPRGKAESFRLVIVFPKGHFRIQNHMKIKGFSCSVPVATIWCGGWQSCDTLVPVLVVM